MKKSFLLQTFFVTFFANFFLIFILTPCFSQQKHQISKRTRHEYWKDILEEKIRISESNLEKLTKNKPIQKTKIYQELIEIIREKDAESHGESYAELDTKLRIDENKKTNGLGKISVGTETNITRTSSIPESETHVYINPKDENNLVASAISSVSTGLECPIYYTTDGGTNWELSEFNISTIVPSTILGGGDPFFTADADGNFYFTWIALFFTGFEAEDSIYATTFYAKSTDKGVTWDASRDMIVGGSGEINSAQSLPATLLDKQWLTCDRSNSKYRNNLYCVYTYLGEDLNFIGVGIKKPNETKFSDPTPASGFLFTDLQFANLEVDKDGVLYCTFYGALEDEQPAFWICNSKDGGVTFSEPIKITDFYLVNFSDGAKDTVSGVPGSRLYPCPQMAIDKGNSAFVGNIYFTFTAQGISEKENYNTDVYITKSTDKGQTWSKPAPIHSDRRRHQYYSTLQVTSNGVVVNTWYDRIADSANRNANYMINFSTDGGNTFAKDLPLSQKPSNFNVIGNKNGGFGVGDYNGMAVSENYAYPVWGDGRTNNGNVEIYFAKVSISEGIIGSVGVINKNDLSEINISPNPALKQAKVEFNSLNNQTLVFALFNSSGKLVYKSAPQNFSVGSNTFSIDVSNFEQGAYICEISTHKGEKITISKKLSIVK